MPSGIVDIVIMVSVSLFMPATVVVLAEASEQGKGKNLSIKQGVLLFLGCLVSYWMAIFIFWMDWVISGG